MKRAANKASGVTDTGEVRIYQVRVALGLSDLEAPVRRFGADIMAGGKPLFLTVDGFNNDPRDLSEIPEVALLMQRVVESGLIGLLGHNENIGLGETNMLIDAKMCFALAKGALITRPDGGATGFMTPALTDELGLTLQAANEKIERLIGASKSN